MKAYELIEKPEAWNQGQMKHTRNNGVLCFCAVGAIREKYGFNEDGDADIDNHPGYRADIAKLVAVVDNPSASIYTNERRIESWNDSVYRTHAQVLAAMKEADV